MRIGFDILLKSCAHLILWYCMQHDIKRIVQIWNFSPKFFGEICNISYSFDVKTSRDCQIVTPNWLNLQQTVRGVTHIKLNHINDTMKGLSTAWIQYYTTKKFYTGLALLFIYATKQIKPIAYSYTLSEIWYK